MPRLVHLFGGIGLNESVHRCLGEHETECPNCAQAHGLIKEIKRGNDLFAQQQDVFLSSVKDTGFEAIADGFSKGILGPRLELPAL